MNAVKHATTTTVAQTKRARLAPLLAWILRVMSRIKLLNM